MNTVEIDNKYIMQVFGVKGADGIVMAGAEGMYLYDVNGKAYLDFSAQFSACCLGHKNQELINHIGKQLQKLVSVTSVFVTDERAALAEKLAEITPDGLEKCAFGCTGSDANEFALKVAKYYKGGGKVISFSRGFHGSTAGSAAATGKAETIQEDASISELLPGGFIHASPPYCYRCEFGKHLENCDLFCLFSLENLILQEGGENIAAIIIEPIFAAGGVIVPPDGYFNRLRAICDKYGILLIFDEVVTGFGQTGRMFACENSGVSPDILVVGKAMSGGYIPCSGVIVKREIGEKMDGLSLHGHTHSMYPLACASALKNIEIIERDNLIENSRIVGDHLRGRLLEIQSEFPEVGDVRGSGLLQGFEIVEPGGKKADHELGEKMFDAMLKNGLITELESRQNLENAVIVLHPPLITSKEDVDAACEIIKRCLAQCVPGRNVR